MKRTHLAAALAVLAFAVPAEAQRNAKAAVNVNSRYTVESVEVEGIDRERFSTSLRNEIDKLIGQHFDQSVLNALIDRMKAEVRIRAVEQKLVRGTQPSSIKVVLEVHRKRNEIETEVPKLAYHSREGWTGAVDSTWNAGGHYLGAGIQSDGTTLVERMAGIYTHYEWRPLLDERVKLRFDYANLHQNWNTATREEILRRRDLPGIYRGRNSYTPSLAFQLARGLTASVGASFEDIDFVDDTPAGRATAAARGGSRWSNTAGATLRYGTRWNDTLGPDRDTFEAAYTVRAATRALSSDFVFARHTVSLAYGRQRRHIRLDLQARAGTLSGAAPLYERFVLGNSQTLRGWSKWDLAPVGAANFEYASVQMAYRWMQVYYDTGATWEHGAAVVQRHAAGFGVGREEFLVGLGFPLRSGRTEPIFFVAMKF
jgi:hypothetical protein